MGITVSSEAFLTVLKTGLSKVKDSSTSIAASKKGLTVRFAGSAVTYQVIMEGEGKSFSDTEFDATNLSRLIATWKGEIEINVDGPELTVKRGRSIVTVPCAPSASFMSEDETEGNVEVEEEDKSFFRGWIKNHPLNSATSLKRALQSIKDNVTKTELVVEAEWGKTDLLKVQMIDQFHGILAYVKLPEVPQKKKVRIRIPMSAFLQLLDVTGDLYVDNSKVMIKDGNQALTCRFIANAAFGSIDDMVELVSGAKADIVVDGKELHSIVKRATAISEQDDVIVLSSKKKNFIVECATMKASVKEVIDGDGSLAKPVSLSPKNLQDITSCLEGKVSLSDMGHSIVFKSKKGDIQIHGAVVKREG